MAINTIDDNNIITAGSEAWADGTAGARFDSQRGIAATKLKAFLLS
jgi:hypothetical protein